MNCKNWKLEVSYLDEDDFTAWYEGKMNNVSYKGYIVDIPLFHKMENENLTFEEFLEKYKSAILSILMKKIINKPRFNDLPRLLQDMYSYHGHSQVYMIYYDEDYYEEDVLDKFTDDEIEEANEFMKKNFDFDCYEMFYTRSEFENIEFDDIIVTMYGSIWEQVDFSER